MAIGDGIRRNIAQVSEEERLRFLSAILALDSTKVYGDGVTYWDKQEDIHKDAHAAGQDVHTGPAFLPWHRELCNRFEALIRDVDPALSLHYWDWTTDPRHTPDGKGGFVNLFSTSFMGSSSGDAGYPLQDFESTEGGGHTKIWRDLIAGAPAIGSDNSIVTAGNALPLAQQYNAMDSALKAAHGYAHSLYIRGTIGQSHFSFHDPFVFLLHSNVDRLWALWQVAPGHPERLDPNQVYGDQSTAPSIVANLEPWSGGTPLRPWAPPENQGVPHTPKTAYIVAPPLYDTMSVQQTNWRWCHKCQGLYFAGNPGSHCPAGGAHDHTGSGNYSLVENTPNAAGQSNWRWCHKCQGLYFAGNPGSHCPAGGAHDHTGSGDYRIVQNVYPGFFQHGWRWCHKCQGMYFIGNPGSHCPAGGPHNAAGSGAYTLVQNTTVSAGQANWRWCHKCQGLYFGGNPGSHCPAGAAHDNVGSGNYHIVDNAATAPGQDNWRWCHKCQGMYFAGSPGSHCPAGGAHDHTGSGNYTMTLNLPGPTDQDNWRWCHKCQGMYFAGNPGSHCPAGGAHDHTGSGNYSLLQV